MELEMESTIADNDDSSLRAGMRWNAAVNQQSFYWLHKHERLNLRQY